MVVGQLEKEVGQPRRCPHKASQPEQSLGSVLLRASTSVMGGCATVKISGAHASHIMALVGPQLNHDMEPYVQAECGPGIHHIDSCSHALYIRPKICSGRYAELAG